MAAVTDRTICRLWTACHSGFLLVAPRCHQITVCYMLQVLYFPSGASSLLSHPKPFLLLAVCGLLTSFTSTLMFTAMGSFFNRISDPGMGGAYLTLLNTIANMGEFGFEG